jgi:hypothetical protein
MRLAVRALVVLTFPVLAFGWLTTAQILPGPPDFERAFPPDPTFAAMLFLAVGAALVVAGSIVLTLGDFARGTQTPRPIALPVVALSALAGVGQLSISQTYAGPSETLVIWLEVAVTTATGFVVLLAATVLVRALVGLWSAPELPLRPGRRAVTAVLLLAALAATPVPDQRDDDTFTFGRSVSVVPMAEKVRMELTGQLAASFWRYDDSSTAL